MTGLKNIGKNFSTRPINAQLTSAAVIVGFIYLLVFTLPFLLPRYYSTTPPVDYTKLTGYSPIGFIVYLLAIGILFWLYIWAIRLTRPNTATSKQPLDTPTRHPVLISSALFAAILIFSYPLTAIDLFVYAIRTRGWALYGLQPLATSPDTLPTTDLWLGLAGEWVDAASPYGPLWELLSLGGFYGSGGGYLAHLFALKIISAITYLGCVWLVYKILTVLQPRWVIAGTIAFAWNPLVLFESVQNAHNDIVMVFFMLAAILVLVQTDGTGKTQNRWRWRYLLVCVLLVLSILVKFVTIIVVPFFLLSLARRYTGWPKRFGAMVMYGAIIAGLVAVFMLPLWPGWQDWAVLKAGSGAGRSILALLVLTFRDIMGTNTAFDLARNGIYIVYALIYGYYLWQTFSALRKAKPGENAHGVTSALSSSFFILFWYVLLAAPVFHAWYLLWFLPLAPFLLPKQRPLTASIVFSITALMVIPYFETVRVWYPFLLQNHFLGHLIGVPILALPPALTLLWPVSSTNKSEV